MKKPSRVKVMAYCCPPLAVPGLHFSGWEKATTPIQLRQGQASGAGA